MQISPDIAKDVSDEKPFPKIQEQNVRSSEQEAENNTPDQYKHHTVSIRACAL